MAELCMHTMNRSAYLFGDEDPDLEGQIRTASDAGFRVIDEMRRAGERFGELGVRIAVEYLPWLLESDDHVSETMHRRVMGHKHSLRSSSKSAYGH